MPMTPQVPSERGDLPCSGGKALGRLGSLSGAGQRNWQPSGHHPQDFSSYPLLHFQWNREDNA